MRLTFVRHGQTPDNSQRIWQGWGGRGLSPQGIRQAKLLGARLAPRSFDRVLTSDIERVVETSAYLGKSVEIDRRWREINVGSWANRSIPETWNEHRDVFEALQRGEDIRVGFDGESISEFHTRIEGAVRSLIDEHDEGDEVLVVSHGGVIGGLTASIFESRWPMSPTAPIQNTALTTFAVESDGSLRLEVFNDDTHLPGEAIDTPDQLRGLRSIRFVRHGESNGNVTGRWEGHTCSGLTDRGIAQARRLGEWWSGPSRIISSSVLRATTTAEAIANGEAVVLDQALRELHAGSWEGLTFPELEAKSPELADRIYRHREDLPRGGDGETWVDLTTRIVSAVNSHVEASQDDLAIVSHGSAIRSYLLDAMGLGWESLSSLALLPNTGMAEVLLTDRGPRLKAYGLTPHLT